MAAPDPPCDLASVIRDGRWLAHRYDEVADTIRFRFVDREAHASVTFLTDAELGEGEEISFPRAECLAQVRQFDPPPPRFIVHSAFCCSTMLARAFDMKGMSLGIKEPVILNDVAGLQLRGGDPRQVAAALDVALWLLARPIAAGEAMVIKPSNVFNPLLPAVRAMRPATPVLLLHAPLETYLGSVARKGLDGRLWVRELMWKLIRLGQVHRFGYSEEELFRQSDLQVAALGWLAQQASFAELASEGGEQVRTLDSEILIERSQECMAALGDLFALSFDAEAVASGPAFRRHSKHGASFSAEERARERNEGLAAYAAEIGMVLGWSEAVARHCGISVRLPAPLL
jgi:hypothetical protein